MNIKCLFVDLGDVIYKIDSAKANLNLDNLGLSVKFLPQDPLIDLFEKGEVQPDKFLQLLKEYLPIIQYMPSDEQIINAFNSILETTGFMIDRLEYLFKLKQKFPELRIYLLSNTNEIHITRILNQAKIQNVEHLLDKIFTDKFFSCRLGFRKPELKIYQKACKLAKVNPQEILFIDDNHDNIIAGKTYGLNTIELKTVDLESFTNAIKDFFPET